MWCKLVMSCIPATRYTRYTAATHKDGHMCTVQVSVGYARMQDMTDVMSASYRVCQYVIRAMQSCSGSIAGLPSGEAYIVDKWCFESCALQLAICIS